jgi:methylmalonyl-CoA mutase N-terminal domain/subunit
MKKEIENNRCMNMVPPVLAAVRAYATVGEICQIWREEFGIFEPSTVF